MMQLEEAVLWIFLVPFAPFLIYILFNVKFSRPLVILSSFIEIVLAAWMITNYWGHDIVERFTLLEIGGRTVLQVGYWINKYSLTLLITVAIISSMVRIYSNSYLKTDKRRNWFMVLLSFFTFSMYGIVLMPNLLAIFFFWEWVGLTSYLMIGFWNQKPEAAQAAKKAFLYNKLGDVGFIIALGLVYYYYRTFDIDKIYDFSYRFTDTTQIIFNVSILTAVFVKSAQLPFSVWLPDAMEGPTPASALIHSATMVIAGIYLVIRVLPLFSPGALELMIYVGLITSFWGTFAALTSNDIKKVLAYSTVSQLGYMFIALGAGHPEAAFFHLIIHAFYKTPLFLGTGIIIDVQTKYLDIMDRNTDAKDLRHMYEHWRYTPLLGLFLLPAAMSLAAIPYTSGFLSKEAIIVSLEYYPAITSFTYLGSFFTAIYAGRLLFKPYRLSRNRQISRKGKVNYSANFRLYIPIIILSFFTTYFFFTDYPLEFERSWFYHQFYDVDVGLPALFAYKYSSIAFSIFGIAVAIMSVLISENEVVEEGSIPTEVLKNGFFVNQAMSFLIDKLNEYAQFAAIWIEVNIFERIISILTYSFVFSSMLVKISDKYIIDGIVNGSAKVSILLGNYSRSFQSGNLRSYLIWVLIFLSICIYLIAL